MPKIISPEKITSNKGDSQGGVLTQQSSNGIVSSNTQSQMNMVFHPDSKNDKGVIDPNKGDTTENIQEIGFGKVSQKEYNQRLAKVIKLKGWLIIHNGQKPRRMKLKLLLREIEDEYFDALIQMFEKIPNELKKANKAGQSSESLYLNFLYKNWDDPDLSPDEMIRRNTDAEVKDDAKQLDGYQEYSKLAAVNKGIEQVNPDTLKMPNPQEHIESLATGSITGKSIEETNAEALKNQFTDENKSVVAGFFTKSTQSSKNNKHVLSNNADKIEKPDKTPYGGLMSEVNVLEHIMGIIPGLKAIAGVIKAWRGWRETDQRVKAFEKLSASNDKGRDIGNYSFGKTFRLWIRKTYELFLSVASTILTVGAVILGPLFPVIALAVKAFTTAIKGLARIGDGLKSLWKRFRGTRGKNRLKNATEFMRLFEEEYSSGEIDNGIYLDLLVDIVGRYIGSPGLNNKGKGWFASAQRTVYRWDLLKKEKKDVAPQKNWVGQNQTVNAEERAKIKKNVLEYYSGGDKDIRNGLLTAVSWSMRSV
jgi:hypothetical protein